MKFVNKIRNRLWKQERSTDVDQDTNKRPLREFVYLDEVSLRSLLSSQTGEVTEGTSQQVADTRESGFSGTAGASSPMLAKAELTSNFQTTNSSTLQTSRKATVQSWFAELYAVPNLRFIEPIQDDLEVASTEELIATQNPSVISKSSDLERGKLVEFRVRLNADPVFHLGTIVTEFMGMAEDHPDLFSDGNTTDSLKEMAPINKILQRLLAGLIPVRAITMDYETFVIDGVEYVGHRDALARLKLETKPLEIVGVTEHLAYWKDIRRVLFSAAEFTMLCRISRSGIQRSWTPVKLADLFREIAPGLVEQINTAGRSSFSTVHTNSEINQNELQLADALHDYSESLPKEAGVILTEEQKSNVRDVIDALRSRASSATDQRSAFTQVKNLLSGMFDVQITAERDLELRNRARVQSGLSLFPKLSPTTPSVPMAPKDSFDDTEQRLLDVEVVAIYW